MPRIFKSNNDPLDFCRDCFPTEEKAWELYGDPTDHGEGPDGRGNCFEYDCDHPAYDCDMYTCEVCGVQLEEADECFYQN